jgi:hypothetical protein
MRASSVAHPAEPGDPPVDLVDLRRHPDAQSLRRRPRPPRRTQVLRDLREREADGLRVLDRAQEPDGLLVVAPVAARMAVGRRQEPAPLVVADPLDVDARALRDLADSHRSTLDPYPGT